MKTLKQIQNIIMQNYDLVRENTLLNCHTRGLHSIVLSSANGLLTRIFLTDKDHDMRKNDYRNQFVEKISIAIHPHHVHLNIYPIKGNIYNILFSTNIKVNDKTLYIDKYKRVSKILKGKGGFEFIGKEKIQFVKKELITKQDCQTCTMDGQELHTVYIPKGQESTRIITELSRNDKYDGYNYSNDDLRQWNDNELYKKPDDIEFQRLLNIIGINIPIDK